MILKIFASISEKKAAVPGIISSSCGKKKKFGSTAVIHSGLLPTSLILFFLASVQERTDVIFFFSE
ncbi:hypothetical protein ACJX0J_022004, partial [Zea mays]